MLEGLKSRLTRRKKLEATAGGEGRHQVSRIIAGYYHCSLTSTLKAKGD